MMRKFYFFALALIVAGCLSEKNIDPANSSTFTRYFSDGYINNPVAIEEDAVNGGFIILVNSNLKISDADSERERIQLIKVDAYGHLEWKAYFPDNVIGGSLRWKASNLIIDGNDYAIVGEEVRPLNANKLLVLKVGNDGSKLVSKVYDDVGFPDLSGKAIVKATSNVSAPKKNYYVAAQSPNPVSTDSVIMMEIDRLDANFNPLWTKKSAPSNISGQDVLISLNNKLFYDSSEFAPHLFFGGTKTYLADGSTNFFVSKFLLNGTQRDFVNGFPDFGSPSDQEFQQDFCRKGTGFGVIGYQATGSELSDIFFDQVTLSASPQSKTVYNSFVNGEIIADASNVSPKAEKAEQGNAIYPTPDGGYIIAATIDTYTGSLGRGNTDMYMMKINAGEIRWHQVFGTPNADRSISIRSTSDGGYVLLGQSRLAALETVVLIKTDKDGNVD